MSNFGNFSFDDAEKNAAPESGGFVKMEQGDNSIRVLPPKAGQVSPLIVAVHMVTVPDKQWPVRVVCAKREYNQECPVCLEIEALNATGNEEDIKKAKEMRVRRKAFLNVIHREAGMSPRVWEISAGEKGLYSKLKGIYSSKAGGNFAHPEEGFDLIVTRRGTGFNTTYEVLPDKSSQGPIFEDPETTEAIINAQTDLTIFRRLVNYEELVGGLADME